VISVAIAALIIFLSKFIPYGFYIASFPVSFSGLDYPLALLGLNYSTWAIQIVAFLIYALLGIYIGLLFNRKYNWKQKAIITFIYLILFVPLSSYSHWLKRSDKELAWQNTITAVYNPSKNNEFTSWFIPDYSVCDKLSVFTSVQERQSCLNGILLTNWQARSLDLFVQSDDGIKCLNDDYGNRNKWICVQTVAIEKQDVAMCKIHPFGPATDSCIAEIAIAKKDASLCPQPPSQARIGGYDQSLYDSCLRRILEQN
ncbi:MAG TPA: hypothetical protein VI981_01250, partial [Candidatus Paceibacterota bacterium]